MARWHSLYEKISTMNVDEVLGYNDIIALLGFDANTEINSVRTYMYKAIQVLERNQQRTMECVRGVGYRVIAANEHPRVVAGYMRSMRSKGKKALSKATNVRLDELTQEERRSLADMQLQLSKHEEMLRRLDGRVSVTEKLTKDVWRESKESNAAMAERLAVLEDRIAQLSERSEV